MRQIIIVILLSSALTVRSNLISSIFEGRSIASVREVLKCASAFDYACILNYVEDGVDKAYKDLLREADAGARQFGKEAGREKEDEESPSSIITTITNMLAELPDLLRASLSAALSSDEGDEKTAEDVNDGDNNESNDDDEEEEEADDDEDADADDSEDNKDTVESKTVAISKDCKNNGTCAKVETKTSTAVRAKRVGVSRKRKKGKIQKLKAFIKLAIAAIVIVVKLLILLKLLAAKLQIKFFLIALVNLGINLARFWWDLKKGHHPQKVIYYEHAQHQHHYDANEDWHSSGPSGDSYWSRSYDKVDNKNAQDLAYAKQAPGGTVYSRVDDKPNFSWNPWAERSL